MFFYTVKLMPSNDEIWLPNALLTLQHFMPLALIHLLGLRKDVGSFKKGVIYGGRGYSFLRA